MKLLALLSGGIDSPVAACLMAQRGAEMVLLHMDNRPFSSDLGVRKAALLAEARALAAVPEDIVASPRSYTDSPEKIETARKRVAAAIAALRPFNDKGGAR